MINVEIVDFTAFHTEDVMRLNVEWLEKYFVVEPIDFERLSNPEKYVISQGGKIYVAIAEGEVVGTVALLKADDTAYEISKMAVTDKAKGMGIGKMLMQKCMDEAQTMQLQKVFLFSNTILEAAIKMYRKFGFVEVPIGDTVYKRTNIKMEFIL